MPNLLTVIIYLACLYCLFDAHRTLHPARKLNDKVDEAVQEITKAVIAINEGMCTMAHIHISPAPNAHKMN